MSLTDMFVEKAIESGADKGVVNNLVRKTPLLMSMPSTATNNGRENLYEKVIDIDAIAQTELDAPLQSVSASSEVGREGLLHWSAKQEVGTGKLNELKTTAPAYFAKKASHVFGKTAQNLESTVMYQNIQAKAIANNKSGQPFAGTRVHNYGGTTAANYSIQCVTWDSETTTGLYSKDAFGSQGGVFDVAQIGNGNYLDSNGVLVYGASYQMDFGVQLADPQNVTSIVNITNDATILADIVTNKLDYYMSLMLERADATDGMTALYMHPELLVAIETAFVNSINETEFKMGDFNNKLRTWQGIPIITSRNMYNGTEAKVTL